MELTERELDVARFVASGLTNGEIAARLDVSERTIDGHLQQTFRKLGLSARRQLAQRVLGEEADAAAARQPSRLPAELTSFVGREEEMLRLRELVGVHRLVTLVGPAGAGKTRLAIRVARLLEPGFGEDVHLVRLDGLSEAGLLDDALLVGIGGRLDPGHETRDLIAARLRDRPALVVLDNCEHLAAACAGLCERLLRECPGVRVVATSREPLGLPGERLLPVGPLDPPLDGEALDDEAARRNPALRLLVERAEAAGARPRDLRSLAEICRRLDGLPLALELAAGCLRAASASELAERLTVSRGGWMRMLRLTRRGVAGRHSSLEAAIEWSVLLLSAGEREMYVRLAAFSGPFDAAAAHAVGGSAAGDPGETLEILSALVDKSMLVAVPSESGSTRYRMLNSLRSFGRRRLEESGRYEHVRELHTCHYADVLAEPLVTWSQAALDGVRDQLDDIREALTWSCAAKPALTSLLCGGLVGFWGRRGHLGEAGQWMVRILDSLPDDDVDRAGALANAAWVAQRRGDFPAAERYALDNLRIRKLLGQPFGIADALTRLGDVARHRGDSEAARHHAERGVAAWRTVGDPLELGLGLMVLGSAEGRCGDAGGGRRHLEEAYGLFESLGERGGMAYCDGWLGELAIVEGALDDADARLSNALRVFRDLPDAWMVANLLDLMAWLAGQCREVDRMRRLRGAARRLRDAVGTVRAPSLAVSGGEGVDESDDVGAETDVVTWISYALGERSGAADESRGGLTERQLQIARLIAGGLADKQIAMRLGISVRTAEYHASEIRTRLRCSSRAQVAAWAAVHCAPARSESA